METLKILHAIKAGHTAKAYQLRIAAQHERCERERDLHLALARQCDHLAHDVQWHIDELLESMRREAA